LSFYTFFGTVKEILQHILFFVLFQFIFINVACPLKIIQNKFQ
jgi:hypothetical protein